VAIDRRRNPDHSKKCQKCHKRTISKPEPAGASSEDNVKIPTTRTNAIGFRLSIDLDGEDSAPVHSQLMKSSGHDNNAEHRPAALITPALNTRTIHGVEIPDGLASPKHPKSALPKV
jgi:hypothetical protein